MLKDVLVAAGTHGIVSAFVPLHYRWTASALLPLALVALTATGFSLIIGGLTLVFKRIQLLNDSVMIVVMLASAGALPLIAVPGWMAGAGRVFPPQGRGRLVDPLAGQRRARPRPEEDAVLPVGEQPEGAARVTLVGPRPVHRVRHGHLARRHVDAAVAGLPGGEADGGDLGVGEHDPGDALVGGGPFAAEDVVGDDPALIRGDVGGQGDPGDVAYGPQAVRRAAVLVDRDLAARAGRYADGLPAEPRGDRLAPGADDHHVGLGLGAVI